MTKDFWNKVDRLEELAGKATQEEWEVDDSCGNVFRKPLASSEEGKMPIVLCARTITQFEQSNLDAAYIAVANPVMIQEMIEELRQLEKEADWLAEMQNISIYSNIPARCPEGRKPPRCPAESCAECWREAARKAISEDNNA